MRKTNLFFLSVLITATFLSAHPSQIDYKQFSNAWTQLITSSNGERERLAVEGIRELMQKHEVTIALYARIKGGKRINVQQPYRLELVLDYELEVNLKSGQFIGRGWKPKNREHVYHFFYE